jgi:acylphosphatase
VHVRLRVLVSGWVQGVFFRSETKREAEKRGVKGWVRNLYDGRVEAVLEGEEEAVKKIIDFCRKGTHHARVKDVELKWEDYKGEFRGFKIKWTV